MAKLYSIGCSFTEDFEPFYNDIKYSLRSEYMYNFLGGRIPKSWTELLADKLNIQHKVYGAVNCDLTYPIKLGNTNSSIFYNFCRITNDIQQNDIVIIQWTFLERFLWYEKNTDLIVNVLPNQYPNVELSKDFFDQIIFNKSNSLWYEEIRNYEKIINELAKAKGFEVYFWSIDDKYYEYFADYITNNKQYFLSDLIKKPYYFLNIVKSHGAKTIDDETNGLIKDSHFGEIGHQVIANLFYKHIKNE